jgi:hypothetical protein
MTFRKYHFGADSPPDFGDAEFRSGFISIRSIKGAADSQLRLFAFYLPNQTGA